MTIHITNEIQQLTPEKIRQYISFWNNPSAGIQFYGEIPYDGWNYGEKVPYPLTNGRLINDLTPVTWQDIDTDALAGIGQPLPQLFYGDVLHGLSSKYPSALLEGAIGCSLYASNSSFTAKPFTNDLEQLLNFSLDKALDSPWMDIARRLARALVMRASGQRPVCQLHMRGISDMLSAYLGELNMCYLIYDAPEKLHTLAEKFLEVYFRMRNIISQEIPTFCGGYVSVWGLYAPEQVLDYQIDASVMFSPDMYSRHFLPYDIEIIKRFPYQVLHIHHGGLHMVDELVKIKELRCIQIVLEKETGQYDFNKIAHAIHTIHAHYKGVVIYGELTQSELNQYLSTFTNGNIIILYYSPIQNKFFSL